MYYVLIKGKTLLLVLVSSVAVCPRLLSPEVDYENFLQFTTNCLQPVVIRHSLGLSCSLGNQLKTASVTPSPQVPRLVNTISLTFVVGRIIVESCGLL